MINKITLLILTALLAVGTFLNDTNYLMLAFAYASMYAAISYYDGFRRGAGIINSTITEPDPVSSLYWLTYCVIVAATWKYYPIWAALLTPWILHITLLNITAYLLAWGIIEFESFDEDDVDDDEE